MSELDKYKKPVKLHIYDTPGGGKPFTVTFQEKWFNQNDVLLMGDKPTKLLVTKVRKYTWWRRILLWLGFSITFYEGKVINNE